MIEILKKEIRDCSEKIRDLETVRENYFIQLHNFLSMEYPLKPNNHIPMNIFMIYCDTYGFDYSVNLWMDEHKNG